MDLTDWKRMVDGAILARVTTAHVHPGSATGGERPKTDVGRKPYGDGFADLLRFCRNAYEHPPAGDEVEPIVATLAAEAASDERGPDGETDTTDEARSSRCSRRVSCRAARTNDSRGESEGHRRGPSRISFRGYRWRCLRCTRRSGPDVARGAEGGEEMRKRGGRRGGGHGARCGSCGGGGGTATRTSNR